MSTTLERTPELVDRGIQPSRSTLVKVLLACGVLYGVVYAVVHDLIAATIYDGYDRMSQAISELSATGASTRGFLVAMLPIFTGLMIAFGLGVWKAADGSRALRVTGAILMAHGVVAIMWLPFPMTARADMIEGTMPATDLGHIILSAATGVFVLAELGFGAAAYGWWFRAYSLLTAIAVVVFGGVLTGIEAAKVPSGDPTPYMGLYERIGIGAWMLWMAVLAIMLLRPRSLVPKVRAPDTPAELLKTTH